MMVDDRTIAEYADDAHTGPHLPHLVPDIEEPTPAEAAPPPPRIPSINSQPPTINSSSGPSPAKPELETCVPSAQPELNSGNHVPSRKRRRRPGGALNAAKHGIFVTATSGTDLRRLRRYIRRFASELQPVGAVEEALVEKVAVTYLRLQRCARAEFIYYDATWRPQPGRQIRSLEDVFNSASFEKTVTLINRYDASLTNQLTKLLKALACLQEARLKKSAAVSYEGTGGPALSPNSEGA